jgi:hypothetical protein
MPPFPNSPAKISKTNKIVIIIKEEKERDLQVDMFVGKGVSTRVRRMHIVKKPRTPKNSTAAPDSFSMFIYHMSHLVSMLSPVYSRL